MTREAMLLKKLTNKQLLKELNFRIRNGVAIQTLIAGKKMELLKREVDDATQRLEDLESLAYDIECL